MRILIVPDKFKNSLTSDKVCEAIEAGLRESGLLFTAQVIPMADGGEGTGDLLTRHFKGQRIDVEVYDPLGRTILANYGISDDKSIAFIEVASASGLHLLRKEERNPAITSSYGTGQVIDHALSQGVKEIMLGVGGSASNDGGIGMAHALGAHFYNDRGDEINPIGKNLINIHSINIQTLNPLVKNVCFKILCDVENPLYGRSGAAHVYGAQKGADEASVIMLDEGLFNLANVVNRLFKMEVNFPGAGAGGGIGACSKLIFNNHEFHSGSQYLISLLGIENIIIKADVVITGEGKMDLQTQSGKVIKGISDLCLKHHKPLYAIVGHNALNDVEMNGLGIKKCIALTDYVPLDEAISEAFDLIRMHTKSNLSPVLKS